jgi:hypothetical protein
MGRIPFFKGDAVVVLGWGELTNREASLPMQTMFHRI